MKTINTCIILLSFLMYYSCGSSKTKATPEQLKILEELANNKNFEIISDVAYPQATSAMNSLQNSGLIRPGSSVNRISLIGNSNYVKIIGDSVYAELPYYGERQMNVTNNGSNSSISIKNVIQNYSVEKNVDDNSYNISFDAKNRTETFSFNITMYSNLDTNMFLNSTSRFSIRYSGASHQLE